jgi:hypothetical protein
MPASQHEDYWSFLEDEDIQTDRNRTVADFVKDELDYDGDTSTRIIAGELGAGSPYEAFDGYLGIQLLGRMTGLFDEAESFLIGGGLKLKNPNKWGKRQEQYLRQYRQDPQSDKVPDADRLEAVAEAAGFESLEEIEAYEEELRGLLQYHESHKGYVRDRLGEMLAGFEGDIEYGMGEEEREFNLKEEKERLLNKLAKDIEEYREEKQADLDSKEDELEGTDEQKGAFDVWEEVSNAYESLKTIHTRIQNFYNAKEDATQDDLQDKIDELSDDIDEEIEGLDNVYRSTIQDLFSFDDKSWENYRDEYKALEEDWGETKDAQQGLIDRLQGDINEIKDDLANIETEEGYALLDLTNRKHIKQADAKILHYLAKRNIQEDVLETFPRDVRDQVRIHNTKQAEISDDTEMSDELKTHQETLHLEHRLEEHTDLTDQELEDHNLEELRELADEYDLPEEEDGEQYEASINGGDSLFSDSFMMHNTKWSNTPSEMSLMEAYHEAIRKHRHADRIKGDPYWAPDTMIVPHNAAGFEYIRRNLRKPLRGDDEDPDPHEVSVMTLPPMLDQEQLEQAWAEGKQDRWTKMVYKGELNESIPTGIIVQTRLDNDSEIPLFIPEDLLTDLGSLGRDLMELEGGSEEYEETLDKIQQLTELPLAAVMANADWHVGKPDVGVERTHRDKIWRTLNAQQELYGDTDIPKTALFSELIDGRQDWYGEENTNNAETPNFLRDQLRDELEERELTELAEELGDYYANIDDLDEDDLPELLETQTRLLNELLDWNDQEREAMMQNMDFTPAPGYDVQDRGTWPYIRFIDDEIDPESFLLVAGNHPASKIGTDEAHDLDKSIRAETGRDRDEIHILDGQGTIEGGYGALTDHGDVFTSVPDGTGTKFYLQHVTGASKHFLRKNKKDAVKGGKHEADVIIKNHIHQSGWTVLSDGTQLYVTRSVWDTDQRGEVSNYGHSSWGVDIPLVNAAPEDHPLNDYAIGALHSLGPETLVQDEFAGDPLDQELEVLDEVKGTNPDSVYQGVLSGLGLDGDTDAAEA